MDVENRYLTRPTTRTRNLAMDKHWWNYYVNNLSDICTCVVKFGSMNDLLELDRATREGRDEDVEDILTRVWGAAPLPTAEKTPGFSELCALLDGSYEPVSA